MEVLQNIFLLEELQKQAVNVQLRGHTGDGLSFACPKHITSQGDVIIYLFHSAVELNITVTKYERFI